MNRPISDDVVVIRGSPKKQALMFAASMGFVLVGGLMLVLPPPENAILPWSMASQSVVGVLAIVFGGIGMGVIAYTTTRPILVLGPDGITDCRRRMTIPYGDIRAVSAKKQQSGMALQWIELAMIDPQEYASIERLSKRSGLSTADLTLDLSLATPVNFHRACDAIEQHVANSVNVPG